MLLQFAAKKVKQLAFTFSRSNDKAITVLETERGWAAKINKRKIMQQRSHSICWTKGEKRLKTIRINNLLSRLFLDLLLGSMYARLARWVFYFRTCAYDAVFGGYRGKPLVFNGFFGICCLPYPFFISSMAALCEVNFRARNKRRRIYVALGTGHFNVEERAFLSIDITTGRF